MMRFLKIALFLILSLQGVPSTATEAFTPGSWKGFARTLHLSWKAQESKLSYEMNSWMQRLFRNDFRNAAHLWPVVQNELPKNFENVATAGYLFALWNLDIPQTFVDAWLKSVGKGTFAQSELALHLENAIAPKFEKWLYTTVPVLDASQTAIVLDTAKKRQVPYIHLAAWSALRSPERANAILSSLPKGQLLSRYLRRSAILHQAKLGNITEAIALVRADQTSSRSERLLAEARLRYQHGDLAGAQKLYNEVADKRNLKQAREELLWVSLRQGDISRLRGELVSLSSLTKDGEFAPDLQVIAALSNLKLCYFDRVEHNLSNYKQKALEWAKQIDQGIAKALPFPGPKDLFTRLEEKRIIRFEREHKTLQALELESLEGPLPAIGVQTHWTRLRNRMSALVQAEQSALKKEYVRRWNYRKARLEDSIRKMRFLHAEFSNQVRRFSSSDPQASDNAMEDGKKALNQRTHDKKAQVLTSDTNLMSFPVDEVLWEDEIFHMRSVAQTYCLAALEKKGG